MVSIAALIMAPVLLGALIYGATVIFPKHPVSPAHKDINNATDLLNATIHTASIVATLSWHYTATTAESNTSPTAPKPTMHPEESQTTIDTPVPTRAPLHDGKEPQEEEEEEEEGAAAGKVSAPRPNHSEGRRRVSKLETIHEQDETVKTPTNRPEDLQLIDTRINQIADQQIETLGTELQGIVSNVLDSDEAVQFADVFEGLAQDSLTLSSPPNPSRFDILPVIMALLKPVVLNLRADIRNTLIWLCQGEPGSTIDGKVAVDKAAKQALLADQTAVVHPNGTIYFMDLFDPNLGKIALDCVQGHSSSVLKGVTDLFWTRLGQMKEFLLEQLRVAIGLPKFPVGAEGLEMEGGDLQEVAKAVDAEGARAFVEWMMGRVLEKAERSPPPTDLSRLEDAIGKEQVERDEHNVDRRQGR
ncbi:hypothetical protein BG005_010165 [Podila minutissima]|nr:hypothetical protein BG005_010165 [Podila minutissima]